ncbi:MAG TPA: STAS domain-containing protein [Candidatus Obscuribacterales bacterium]
MAFTTTLEINNGIAKIQLVGELDASSAPILKTEIEQAAAQNPKRLVLLMQDLEYMSSAGLRVLIFAKQKMGADKDIFIIGLQEMVHDTLTKTGYDQSVIILDEYDANQIENV